MSLALSPGTRLGPYEIVSPIGAGGMGEVYRATDTHLKRAVAIKVLPASVAADADRLARFQREAEVLAALNHPNIAAIYGLEKTALSTSSGQAECTALVMELVEGEDLSAHIARGPIALPEALPIARQIIDALEAAHEQGIVHRDLKPANVKVRADGMVKVLDFGLAKALAPEGASAAVDARNSPTLTAGATQMGMILGTAAYMAPEQARGKAVDKRADIWAFGAVLFEMLTGTRPFDGEDVAETMGAVIHKEPDWARLPAVTPPSIVAALRRCLQKDSKRRLRDIGDVRLALEGAFETVAPGAAAATVAIRAPLWRRVLPVTLAVVLTAALANAIVWSLRPPPRSLALTRSSFLLPDGQQFTNTGRNAVAISPDGARMVYVANRRLYIRSLSQFEAAPIPGSENFQAVFSPVFSPDGQSVAFYAFAEGAIKKIAITGGSAVTICPAKSLFGMSWGPEGILFGDQAVGIMRVSPDGGTPQPVVRTKEGETAYGPELLPDGTHVLFTLVTGSTLDRWDKAAIVVQSLGAQERKVIVAGGSDGRYLPTGHVVYAVGGTLFAVAFDARRLEARGGAVPVVEGVARASAGATGVAHFSVSGTGSLIYMSGPASTSATSQVQVALIDPKGTVDLLPIPAGSYQTPRVSPNGKQIVLVTAVATGSFLSVADLTSGTAMRRLTFEGNSLAPIWSRDSQRVAFQSDRDGDLAIFWQRADGTGSAERLTKPATGTAHLPESWSPKDQTLLFSALKGSSGTLSTFSRERREEAAVGWTRSAAPGAALSPDGRWLAYASYETGLRAINVEPFPPSGAKYQLPPRSGVSARHPVWSADGKALIYTGSAGELETVSVTTQPTFAFGNPIAMSRPFRSASGPLRDWDIAPDGKFLGLVTPGSVASGAPVKPEIRVVINWFEELTNKVSNRK